MWCIVTVSMETPSYLSIFIDTKKNNLNHHENDTFQHIMPYDTSNERALRVLSEYQQFECVLVTWLPWQQISSQNQATN